MKTQNDTLRLYMTVDGQKLVLEIDIKDVRAAVKEMGTAGGLHTMANMTIRRAPEPKPRARKAKVAKPIVRTLHQFKSMGGGK
jgi:hypothetical protein